MYAKFSAYRDDLMVLIEYNTFSLNERVVVILFPDMAAAATATIDLRRQIAEYGTFVERTLRPQLQTAVEDREETEGEISEYLLLRNELRLLLVGQRRSSSGDHHRAAKEEEEEENSDPPPGGNDDASAPIIRAVIDISHASVYCDVVVPNPRTIYVDVGLGFHVEMMPEEAISFVDRRVEYLEKNVLNHRLGVAATVARDVENALELLEELGEELAGL
jgi:hypothetical protein